jgi:catalase-peroxidase
MIWQDPLPAVNHKLVERPHVKKLKQQILESGLSVPDLVRTAWASASSFRAADKRGGANGARISLAPQKDWTANDPAVLKKVLDKLRDIQSDFNEGARGGFKISLADLIVLAGATAVEKGAIDAGIEVSVPFFPGRTDAVQEQTDVRSFALLEPQADAFRNYFSEQSYRSPTEMLVDRAGQLKLTVPEMTVLIGGMRTLNANTGSENHGVFTDEPGTLSNDFFVNLLDMSTVWRKTDTEGVYEGLSRMDGRVKYTATPVDLIFGSSSELRAIAEVYAYDNAQQRFVNDFVSAWGKVMQLDRFDL